MQSGSPELEPTPEMPEETGAPVGFTPVDIHIDLAPSERVYLMVETCPDPEGGPPVVRVVQQPAELAPGSQQAPANWAQARSEAAVSGSPPVEAAADRPASAGQLPGLRGLAAGAGQLGSRVLQHPATKIAAGKITAVYAPIFLVIALAVLALVLLAGLDRFPLSFTAREAFASVTASAMTRNGLRGPGGDLMPAFFPSEMGFSEGLMVYVQMVTAGLFGQSVALARLSGALAGIIGGLFLALLLHKSGQKAWWLAPVLLAAAPGWFAHTRAATGFGLFAAGYLGFLYFYLRYAAGSSTGSLYPAAALAGLAFYAWPTGQPAMLALLLAVAVIDLARHRAAGQLVWLAVSLLLTLAIPFIAYLFQQPSGWFGLLQGSQTPTGLARAWQETIQAAGGAYLKALNPLQWFFPTSQGSTPFSIPGASPLPLLLLPFGLAGLGWMWSRRRQAAGRLAFMALLTAPVGAAAAAIVNIRLPGMEAMAALPVMLVYTWLTAAGLWMFMTWAERRLRLKWLALAAPLGLLLAISGLGNMNNAVNNQMSWNMEFGPAGAQYGAEQVFETIETFHQNNPEMVVILTPNGFMAVDVLKAFFLPEDPLINIRYPGDEIETIDPSIEQKAFLLTGEDYHAVLNSGHFETPWVETIIPYPNGSSAFYLVRLRYRSDIQDVMEAERAERSRPVESQVLVDGEPAIIRITPVENDPQNLFDGDPGSLVKTVRVNPLYIELEFSQPRPLSGLQLRVGAEPVQVTVTVFTAGDAESHIFLAEAGEVVGYKDVPVEFGEELQAARIQVELLDTQSDDQNYVHLWELDLLP